MRNFLVVLLTVALTGCMESQNSVIGADVDGLLGGVPENALRSDRKEHFSRMSTRGLCELALVIESEVYESPALVQPPLTVAERSPFSFGPTVDEITLFPHSVSVEGDPYSNRSLAMKELSSRAQIERQKVCPILAEMNGRNASRAGYDCVDAANRVSANALCEGTYNGKAFSVMLADIIILRRQAERNAAERRRLRARMAPVISCTSSELFGTVRTTCY